MGHAATKHRHVVFNYYLHRKNIYLTTIFCETCSSNCMACRIQYYIMNIDIFKVIIEYRIAMRRNVDLLRAELASVDSELARLSVLREAKEKEIEEAENFLDNKEADSLPPLLSQDVIIVATGSSGIDSQRPVTPIPQKDSQKDSSFLSEGDDEALFVTSDKNSSDLLNRLLERRKDRQLSSENVLVPHKKRSQTPGPILEQDLADTFLPNLAFSAKRLRRCQSEPLSFSQKKIVGQENSVLYKFVYHGLKNDPQKINSWANLFGLKNSGTISTPFLLAKILEGLEAVYDQTSFSFETDLLVQVIFGATQSQLLTDDERKWIRELGVEKKPRFNFNQQACNRPLSKRRSQFGSALDDLPDRKPLTSTDIFPLYPTKS